MNVGDTIRTNEYDYITVKERDENIIKINVYSDGLHGWTKYKRGIGIIERFSSNAIMHITILVKSELK